MACLSWCVCLSFGVPLIYGAPLSHGVCASDGVQVHDSGVMEAWSDYVFELDPAKPPEPVALEHLQGLRCILHVVVWPSLCARAYARVCLCEGAGADL